MPETPEILSPKEVKNLLKISLAGVYRMAERGTIPSIRFGDAKKKTLRFKKSDVWKFIEAHYSG